MVQFPRIRFSQVFMLALLLAVTAFPQASRLKGLSNEEYSRTLVDRYNTMMSHNLQKSNEKPDRSKNDLTMLLFEAIKNHDKLTPDAQALFAAKDTRPTGLTQKYEETTKNFFRFYYTTSGTDAVSTVDANKNGVPDYVENMAAAFIKALNFYDSNGYNRPPIAASDNGRFCVYLSNSSAGDNVYGYSVPETYIGDNPATTIVENSSMTSYMVMRDNYTGFGTDLQVAMEVTAAHEFFHCVQFGYETNNMTSFLMEMCSTWAEDMVFPGDDDNWQYLNELFKKPDIALDYLDDENVSDLYAGHWYSTWIFMRYLSDHYGADMPKLIYEKTISYFEPQAINNVMTAKGNSYAGVIKDFYVALGLLTHSSATPQNNYSFQRADDYRMVTKPNGGPFLVNYENTIAYSGTKTAYASTSGDGMLMRAGVDYLKITANGNFYVKVSPTSSTSALSARLLKLDNYTNPSVLSVVDGVQVGSDFIINVPDESNYADYLLLVYNTAYATSLNQRDDSSIQYNVTIDKAADGITVLSPNGGEAWQSGSTHPISWIAGSVSNVKIEYTTDNGSNWTTIAASVPASSQLYSWTLPSSTAAAVKVRISDASNAGTNSVSADNFSIIPASPISVTSPNGGESWEAGSVNPVTWTSTGVTNIKIEYTTDNGADWSAVTSSTPAATGSYSWIVPVVTSSSTRFRLSDASNSSVSVISGMFSITPAPATAWQRIASGLKGNIWGIDYADAKTVWIASDSGDVALSVDGGLTFTPAGQLDQGFVSIAALNGQTAVAVTGPNDVDGAIYRTTNGGATWAAVLSPANGWFDIIGKTDPLNLWALSDPVGGKFAIFKSTDAGATWASANNLPTAPAGNVYGANNSGDQIGNTIWFGCGGDANASASNRIYKSVNGPDGPWTYATTTQQYSGSVSFSSASGHGLVGFWDVSNTQDMSPDGGSSWTENTIGVGITNSLAYVRGTSTVYAATSYGLFKSTDDGASWKVESIPTGISALTAIRIFDAAGNVAMAGGPDGVLLRKADQVNGIKTTNAAAKVANFSLDQNYPNPFNPTTNIKFSLAERGNVTLTIYNQLGQRVAVLVNGEKAAGTYEVTWNANHFASGVYFYELRTDKFSVVKKLLLMK